MSGWTRRADRSHRERHYYICYERRVGGDCLARSMPQDDLEDDVEAILGAIVLPDGFAQAVETALAGQASRGRASNNAATLKSVEARKGRLRDLYEFGDIAREEYLRRREGLDCEVTSLRAASQQTFRVQRAEIRSLVDDWRRWAPTSGNGSFRRSSRRSSSAEMACRSSCRAKGGDRT